MPEHFASTPFRVKRFMERARPLTADEAIALASKVNESAVLERDLDARVRPIVLLAAALLRGGTCTLDGDACDIRLARTIAKKLDATVSSCVERRDGAKIVICARDRYDD
jgi:hypothetical protein